MSLAKQFNSVSTKDSKKAATAPTSSSSSTAAKSTKPTPTPPQAPQVPSVAKPAVVPKPADHGKRVAATAKLDVTVSADEFVDPNWMFEGLKSHFSHLKFDENDPLNRKKNSIYLKVCFVCLFLFIGSY